MRKGWGQPSIFNADLVVEELLRQGKSLEDARCGGTSGCVETGAFGKEAWILTGYFNLPKVLEIAMHNGVDPRSGKRIGVETGDPRLFGSYEEVFRAFRRQLRHFIEIKVRGNNVIERLYARHMPAPFLSVLVEGCVEKGRDYNDAGPRYNTTYIQGVAPGTCTDSLSAIRHHVFENKTLSMSELLESLDADFEGHERTRLLLWNRTPKYGNDDERADHILRQVIEAFHDEIDGRPNTKGGTYRANYLSTTCHVYFGSRHRRHAGRPQRRGSRCRMAFRRCRERTARVPPPSSSRLRKMDHVCTGGTLLNQKFTPQIVEGEQGLDNLLHLVRSWFRMKGHHIQFNVVTGATLRAAKANPEKYRDLIVRVAGYSDYFCDLTDALQDEIIARTEQTAC